MINLQIGLAKPDTFLLMFPPDPCNTNLPATLKDGEQATFLMPKEQFEKEIVKTGPDVRSRLDRRWIKVGVHIHNGNPHYARLNPDVQERVVELIERGDSKSEEASA